MDKNIPLRDTLVIPAKQFFFILNWDKQGRSIEYNSMIMNRLLFKTRDLVFAKEYKPRSRVVKLGRSFIRWVNSEIPDNSNVTTSEHVQDLVIYDFNEGRSTLLYTIVYNILFKQKCLTLSSECQPVRKYWRLGRSINKE